jgi:hypothetical protein
LHDSEIRIADDVVIDVRIAVHGHARYADIGIPTPLEKRKGREARAFLLLL